MPATRHHTAIEALRRSIALPDAPQTRSSQPITPLRDGAIDPALFAGGLHEMIGESPADFAAALAFALGAAAQGRDKRALFFGTLAAESQERGQLYGAGLAGFDLDPAGIILLSAPSEKALLWVAEEAASCPSLDAALIALGAREKLYGFTASRRLKLRQEKSGVPMFLVRARTGEPTAATARWHVACAPSQGLHAPGSPVPLPAAPRFLVRLERYAGQPPQQWEIEIDEAHRFRVAAPLSDRPFAARRARDRRAA